MICLYHSADLDGHCSGAVVRMKYPDCELHGINYGDEFPWEKVKDQEVIMVDFCLQPFSEQMPMLADACKKLLWIDHHESEIKEFTEFYAGIPSHPNLYPVLDKNLAACELVWKYFYTEPLPEAVTWLGRYDVWDHEDPHVMPFQWGMRTTANTLPENQSLWQRIFYDDDFCNQIYLDGINILDYRDAENAKYIKGFAFETEFEGLKFIAINRGMTNSQMFDSIYDPEVYDGMLTFARKRGQWTVSMYGTKGIDLSAIAKKHGGGGHKQACGFQCADLPFKY